MKSVMKHNFSMVPRADIPRSTFDRSHGYKTTMNADGLYPLFVDEVLPGDTLNLQATIFGRLNTPIVPLMDNLFVDTFYFFVPNRLVWNNWQKFNGEQVNPGDSTDYVVPHVIAGSSISAGITFYPGQVGDYFGLPVNVPNITANALFFRAYFLIWNEWFRDQNLEASVDFPRGDGPDNYNGYYPWRIMHRCKRHDYFTSCLPWPQKGPGVELPLGGTASLYKGDGTPFDAFWNMTASTNIGFAISAAPNVYSNMRVQPDGNVTYNGNPSSQSNIVGIQGRIDALNGAYADLSGATAVTINTLRQAFQLQRLLERDARGGTRYTEILRSHFGVVSPDGRLQRPEFLGGNSQRINIHPVQQTSSTDSISPQGNLAAFGVAGGYSGGFVKSFTEHGVVIGLANIRADLTYQQGINRMFSRKTRFDYYWPALAHLGEQAVLSKEIYSDGTSADDEVFGYQERYAEYRYKPSQITGKFRSSDPQSLDIWHLSQSFASRPSLNRAFIEPQTPIDRVVAVPSEPHFQVDVYYDYKCTRPMPTYSVPGLIDHF